MKIVLIILCIIGFACLILYLYDLFKDSYDNPNRPGNDAVSDSGTDAGRITFEDLQRDLYEKDRRN